MNKSEQTGPDEAKLQQHLSQRLKESREFLNLSQGYVAEQLAIPRAAISAIETCRRKVSSGELKQFSRLYKRTPQYLLGEDNEEFTETAVDNTLLVLYHTTKELSSDDKAQVLKFAEFLRQAGTPSSKE